MYATAISAWDRLTIYTDLFRIISRLSIRLSLFWRLHCRYTSFYWSHVASKSKSYNFYNKTIRHRVPPAFSIEGNCVFTNDIFIPNQISFCTRKSPLRPSDAFSLHRRGASPYSRSHLTKYEDQPTCMKRNCGFIILVTCLNRFCTLYNYVCKLLYITKWKFNPKLLCFIYVQRFGTTEWMTLHLFIWLNFKSSVHC